MARTPLSAEASRIPSASAHSDLLCTGHRGFMGFMDDDNRSLQLCITHDDAALLLVALWLRTRDAANRGDYEDLRSRLLDQLAPQGIEATAADDADDCADGDADLMLRSPVCFKC